MLSRHRRPARLRFALALAVAVVAGQWAALQHSVVHSVPDPTHCNLCAHHGQPTPGLLRCVPLLILPVPGGELYAEPANPGGYPVGFPAYLQRAPPTLSVVT